MLGVYWAPQHDQSEHLRHIEVVNGETRIMAPDVQHVHDAYSRTHKPIQLRWWEVDDHDGQAARDIYASPEVTGRRHAEEFRRRIDAMRHQANERGLLFPPDDLLWVMGINEPPIWEHDFRTPFVRYEVTFLDVCRDLGLNALACRFATSHPADLDGNKRPIWAWLEPVFRAIVRGGHRLDLHEYWYLDGPLTEWAWGWHPGRHWKCPWIDDVKVVIGECGVDLYVDEGRWIAAGRPQRGWQGHVSPEEYANQLVAYMEACHPNVVSVHPFIADYQAKTWWSFDLKPAYGALNALWERVRHQFTPEARGEKQEIHLPIVGKEGEKVTWKPDVDWLIEQMSKVIGIDPRLAKAFILVESGGVVRAPDVVIRFEPHIFKQYVDTAAFNAHFVVGQPEWDGRFHRYRDPNTGTFKEFHGNQAAEYQAFLVAYGLNREGAYCSTSAGAGQIMGFNHKLVGYPTAEAMFQAYGDPEKGALNQVIGFFAYCMNRAGMREAMRAGDYRTMARLFNGAGQVDYYAALIERKYRELGG